MFPIVGMSINVVAGLFQLFFRSFSTHFFKILHKIVFILIIKSL
jgi:hypothetical protein